MPSVHGLFGPHDASNVTTDARIVVAKEQNSKAEVNSNFICWNGKLTKYGCYLYTLSHVAQFQVKLKQHETDQSALPGN